MAIIARNRRQKTVESRERRLGRQETAGEMADVALKTMWPQVYLGTMGESIIKMS